MLERYYIEKEKQEKLLSRKNIKSDFYNGIYDRYELMGCYPGSTTAVEF